MLASTALVRKCVLQYMFYAGLEAKDLVKCQPIDVKIACVLQHHIPELERISVQNFMDN